MRTTKIAWFLAALCLVLLGIGTGEYFQLSSSSSPRSSSVASTPTATPSTAASGPQPTTPVQSAPHGSSISRTSLITQPTTFQTVPLTYGPLPGEGPAASSNPAPPREAAPAPKPAHSGKPAPAPSATAAHSGIAAHTGTAPVTRGAHGDTPGYGTRTEKSTHRSGRAKRLDQQPAQAYVVQPGDTLWALAATHLGSPYRWTELFNLNRDRAEPGGAFVDPNLVYAGWTLKLPPAGPAASQTKAVGSGPVYVVQPGDTLWALAATHLGSPYRWTELFALNRGRAEPGGRLTDPNVIYAGWTLKFPLNAASISSHAKPVHSLVSKGGTTGPVQLAGAVGGLRAGLAQAARDMARWSI